MIDSIHHGEMPEIQCPMSPHGIQIPPPARFLQITFSLVYTVHETSCTRIANIHANRRAHQLSQFLTVYVPTYAYTFTHRRIYVNTNIIYINYFIKLWREVVEKYVVSIKTRKKASVHTRSDSKLKIISQELKFQGVSGPDCGVFIFLVRLEVIIIIIIYYKQRKKLSLV